MSASQQARPSVPQPIPEARELFWFGWDRKWWVLAAVGVGTFVGAMSAAAVNTLASVMMADLAMDFAGAQWITMIYLVVVSGLLLTFGRLGDMLGHKRLYVWGFAVFAIASFFCAIAGSALALVAARAMQAVGAAMLFACIAAILTGAFPPRQRGQALGMAATWTYIGLTIGPALGGFLATHFGWRSTFYVYIPFCLLSMLFCQAVIPNRRAVARGERFDPAGALTFCAGLTALLLALSRGQDWGWTSPLTLGSLAVATVFLAAFIQIEKRVTYPMLDLSLFRARMFSAAIASAMLNYIALYGVMFLVPFYLIQYRQMDPAAAGVLLSSQAITMAVLAPISGTISDRVDSRIPAALGMAVQTVALVWLSAYGAKASDLEIVMPLMLAGAGCGIFASPNSSSLMGSAPRERQGIASGMIAGSRNVGMVLGVALTSAVFSIRLAAYGGSIGPDPGFLLAFHDAFLVVALCSVVGIVTSLSRGRATSAQASALAGDAKA